MVHRSCCCYRAAVHLRTTLQGFMGTARSRISLKMARGSHLRGQLALVTLQPPTTRTVHHLFPQQPRRTASSATPGVAGSEGTRGQRGRLNDEKNGSIETARELEVWLFAQRTAGAARRRRLRADVAQRAQRRPAPRPTRAPPAWAPSPAAAPACARARTTRALRTTRNRVDEEPRAP